MLRLVVLLIHPAIVQFSQHTLLSAIFLQTTDQTSGLAMLITLMEYGIHQLLYHQINMAWVIGAMLADSQHQDHENTYKVVISGMTRMRVFLSCPAGAGWLGLTGTASPPINLLLARHVLSYSGMIKYSDSVLFCIKYNIHKYVKKARKVVSNYDKAKIRLQVA